MTDVKGTTAIHSNHGYFTFDGNIVGRVKNVNIALEGGSDEFYEVGSAWLQDQEVINRKVVVNVEKGVIDFEQLAYAAGIKANITPGVNVAFQGDYDIIIDEQGTNLLSLSPISGGTQTLTAPFTLDVVLSATKIVGTNTVVYTVTARNCKIIRYSIGSPQNTYWTATMELVGTQIAIDGITHTISI